MSKSILITGITGQDGAYVAAAALARGWRVYGQLRPGRTLDNSALAAMGLARDVELLALEIDSIDAAFAALKASSADHIVNLAASTFVPRSFEAPVETAQANAMSPLFLLEAVRQDGRGRHFVQASTGEVFGPDGGFCDEATPLDPQTPYAVTKAFAHKMTGIYNTAFGLQTSNAILFSHESPHRGEGFLTRKVTRSLAQIRRGQLDVLELGALSAERDWGYAGDYAEGICLMLESSLAEDFVLASGVTHSVREFVDSAARHFGYKLDWRGEGVDETAIDVETGQVLVRVNPAFFRHSDAPRFLGNPAKAERVLGWRRKVGFDGLVAMMCDADYAADRRPADMT